MKQTFARCLQICVETRLQPAIISLWPDGDEAAQYWRVTAVPMLGRIGFSPLLASLLPTAGRRQSPTKALLSSLSNSIDPASVLDTGAERLDQAIEYLLAKRWDLGENLVLAIAGVERWAGPRWRNDASALRAVAQANQQRLFIVYLCTDPLARRRLFSDRREPLYREGMTVLVNADGTM